MSIKDETRYQYNLTLRRDTRRNWRLKNPVLLSGEMGIEYEDITVSDGEETAEFPTASNNQKMVSFKVGNGVDEWNNLPYASGEQGVAGEQGDPLRVDELDTIDRRYLFDARNKGFSFLAIDEGKIYFKLTNGIGEWTEGFPFGQGIKGEKGEKGTSIESVEFTSTTHESGLPHQLDAIDTYTIIFDNGITEDFKIQNGTSTVWSADGTPYPINAQVYHNGKQWLALRENSVEPVEGEDWTEFSADVISGKLDKSSVLQSLGQSTTDVVSQKVVTDAFADFGTRTGPYGLRWNQETDIYTELGATVRTQIQSKMRRCVLNSDGTVNYYLDPFDSSKKEDGSPAILDGTDGNVMVEIPKFYYKHSLNGNEHEWWIGETAEDGMEVHPYFLKDGVTEVDFAYYRAYEGFMQAGVLKSISGVTPTRSLTRAAFRTAARLNGQGWNIAHLHGINAVRLLYLLEYSSFNSQSKLGAGNHTGSDYGMLTGQSNVIGNDSSGPLNNNTWMSYRGIENFYADIWEFIDGFNVNNLVPYVSNVEADFADGVYSGSYIEGTVMPSANSSWIQKITGNFLPTQVGGSSATYITDACWTAATPSLGLHGGDAGYGLSAGAFALTADNAFAYVDADVGAGLSFR